MKITAAALFIVFCSLTLEAASIPKNQLYSGPEIYYVNRVKEGGSTQQGGLYGFRVGYERIKRYHFYLGADFLYATGILDGRLGDQKLRSRLTDINLEERFGYTLASKCWLKPSITPFVGFGNFWEINNYQDPFPIHVHFRNLYTYLVCGFLSHLRVRDNLTVGLNFKIRYIVQGKVKVTHDPETDDFYQQYLEKDQYRVEIPINYYFNYWCREVAIGLVPFYEYRRYGHRANFPHDFKETKFQFCGATLKFTYLY